jgi:carboxypeptidase C (cathepsin A)
MVAKLSGIWDIFYVPTAKPDPYPPKLDKYLHNSAVTSKIGSQSKWVKRNNHVYDQFAKAGDWMRTSLPELETVINAGVRTVIYDGDADYFFNYKGVEAMVRPLCFLLLHPPTSSNLCHDRVDTMVQTLSLNTTVSAQFKKQKFETYDVKGKPAGLYKNAGTFSYLRVFGAGHEVPAYEWRDVARGTATLQMFTQIMSDHHLSST